MVYFWNRGYSKFLIQHISVLFNLLTLTKDTQIIPITLDLGYLLNYCYYSLYLN